MVHAPLACTPNVGFGSGCSKGGSNLLEAGRTGAVEGWMAAVDTNPLYWGRPLSQQLFQPFSQALTHRAAPVISPKLVPRPQSALSSTERPGFAARHPGVLRSNANYTTANIAFATCTSAPRK